MVLDEVLEIQPLEQGVGEFGEADAGAFALQPGFNGILANKVVDGEMFADIPQEGEDIQLVGPVVVVDDLGGVGARKIDKAAGLGFQFIHPALDGGGIVQLTFLGFEAGVADHARGAADQHDRAVACLLEAAECEQGHEASDVEAVGGGVEPAVQCAGFV